MRFNVIAWACLALVASAFAACEGGSPRSKDLPGRDLPLSEVSPGDAPDPGEGLRDGEVAVTDAPEEAGPDGETPDIHHPDANGDAPVGDTPVGDATGDASPPVRCVIGEPCDDHDPCTLDDECLEDETCQGTLVDACDDGIDCTMDACTTAEDCTHEIKPGWCLVDGACYEDGQADPARPCRSCVTALVQDDLIPDDTRPCDDGIACTVNDRCKAGECVGTLMTCDDHNSCTTDSCLDGQCQYQPLDGVCDDGSICTVDDACVEGACVGTDVECGDDSPCTDDSCDPVFGCVHQFNTAQCDDGNVCSVGDRCEMGFCQPGADRLDCDDGNLCTDDGCVPTRPEGCVHIPNIAPCEDGDPCTLGDRCRNKVCAAGLDAPVCDDGNFCTDDRCEPFVGCVADNNSDPCDDGEPCFLDDHCQDGACHAGATPLQCDDGNECTDDSCEEGIGCVNRPNTNPCDDGNVCTMTDTCTAGVCIGLMKPGICDDENDCTGDFCTPDGGCGHKGLPECRPIIVIDYPKRGVTLNSYQGVTNPDTGNPVLDSYGRPVMGVRGHIEYPKPGLMVPWVTINGRDCPVSPVDNTFSCRGDGGVTLSAYPLAVTQGANFIRASCESLPIYNFPSCSNAVCADDENCQNGFAETCMVGTTFSDSVVQSFYYSTKWYPVNDAAPEQSMVQDGLDMFLGPEVWDDNDTSTPDDIATILTLFVQQMDLGSLIQNPVTSGKFGWCKYRVNLYHIRFGQMSVDLIPTWGGLFFKATIPNFSVDVDVPISGFLCPDFSGDVSARSIVLSATALLSMDANGNPVASVVNPDVVVNGLDIDIDGIWGFLFNWIIDFFEDDFASMIEEQFESTIANDIGAAIADAIKGLAIDQSFDLPAFLPGTSPMTLRMVAKPSTLDFTPAGGTVGMKSTIVTTRKTPHQVLGSIGRASCLGATEPKLAFPQHGPLEMGLHDDFFNLIPYALYWGGGLAMPLDPNAISGGAVDLSQYGISELTLKIDFLLPPILSACNPEGQLRIQAGDVGVQADMKLFGSVVSMQMYASLEAEALLTVQKGASGSNELALAINEPTFIDIEIESMAGGLVGAEDSLGKLIKGTALPLVLGALSGKTLATFPIPEIDLHAISDQMPVGSKIAIDIRELLRIHGNTVVSGQIK